MTQLYLSIADKPLCEAVTEQISATLGSSPRLAETPQNLAGLIDRDQEGIILIDAPDTHISGLRALRGILDAMPVLTLGGDGENPDVTESFSLPLRLGHLMSRLRYYLETAPLLRDQSVSFGPYRLEPHKRRLLSEDGREPIKLTEKETSLLSFLSRAQGPASRRDILAEVWGYDERIDTHTLETHIYQLRRKLDPAGENWLISEAGGYRLWRGD